MAGLRESVAVHGCFRSAESLPSDESLFADSPAVIRLDRRDERLASLARTIESEIIPRLMLAHRVQALDPPLAPRREALVSREDVAEFAGIILGHDCAGAAAFVDTLRAEGVTLEAVFLDLMAPAARHLGELWLADLCDFTDVTVGLVRLHQLVHRLSPAFASEEGPVAVSGRALLASMPGDQHAFGVAIVEEFLRRAGWDVRGMTPRSTKDVVDSVRGEWFALVGLSLSAESRLDDMAGLIRAIRQASCNPKVWILVGGRPFVEHPDYVARVGADATAADGRQAARRAHHLLTLRVAHHG